jgi:hypothetical protein
VLSANSSSLLIEIGHYGERLNRMQSWNHCAASS